MLRTIICLTALLVPQACMPVPAFAEPVGMVSNGGVTVTIYDEPCALKAVSNMPYRATWTEPGKRFEGCFMLRPDAGAVVAYFDDGSVTLIPMGAFKPAKSL